MSLIRIRLANPSDRSTLAALFHALWPEGPVEEHSRELEAILSGNPPGTLPLVVFVAESNDQSLLGFLEATLPSCSLSGDNGKVGLRSHAAQCGHARPVTQVQGWNGTPSTTLNC